jgi:hypothetical protein
MREMKWKDRVRMSSTVDGSTLLLIPADCLWECMEWLHADRIDADFTFKGSHFVARLPEISGQHAWDLLETWSPQTTAAVEGNLHRSLLEIHSFA